MAEHPVVDIDGVLERVEGDKELLQELVALFASDKQKQLEQIRGCIQRSDAAGLGSSAHAIKSALGNLGAMKAWDLARQLEFAGKEGRLSEAPTMFSALESSIEEYESAYAALHAEDRL